MRLSRPDSNTGNIDYNIGGEIIELWLERLPVDFLQNLRKMTWLNLPSKVKCYRMENCNSSFGAALRTVFSAGVMVVAGLI